MYNAKTSSGNWVVKLLAQSSRAHLLLSQSNYPDWRLPPAVGAVGAISGRISESAEWTGKPST